MSSSPDRPKVTEYRCSVCGALVTVALGAVTRVCDHKDAPVTASVQATAKGEAQVC